MTFQVIWFAPCCICVHTNLPIFSPWTLHANLLGATFILGGKFNIMVSLQSVFRQFDKDDSGFIEIKELKSVFKSIGEL